MAEHNHTISLKPISVGPVTIATPVYLAPMSGVTDLPFRRMAHRLGAETTVSEMIASGEALRDGRDGLKRASNSGVDGGSGAPHIIQLVGHDPAIMAEAARLCVDLGADIVDLNFGCPAKKVTRKLCGSALMRDLDQALRIVDSVVSGVSVPVTVKMRTGWDLSQRNAPDFARRAEAAGVRLVTVHGRTREQKYSGHADWSFIRSVKQAVSIPVLANGDIVSTATAAQCLKESGADGIMVGRGAQGRPWFPGDLIAVARTGRERAQPDVSMRAHILQQHLDEMLSHHGLYRGIRMARKHVAWSLFGLRDAGKARRAAMAAETAQAMRTAIRDAFVETDVERAA